MFPRRTELVPTVLLVEAPPGPGSQETEDGGGGGLTPSAWIQQGHETKNQYRMKTEGRIVFRSGSKADDEIDSTED